MTREPVPPSPSPSPPPKARSPSSMITMIWPMAWITDRIRSRLPSVAPTHLVRKFLSLIVVRPHSLANASATKVLPVPIGPVKRMPIGHAVAPPSRMFSATRSRSFLTSSMPPTTSKPCCGVTNSMSPKHSRSMISRLRAATRRSIPRRALSLGDGAGGLPSGAISLRIASRVMPCVIWRQLVGALEHVLGRWRLAAARAARCRYALRSCDVVGGAPRAAPGWP